MSDEPGTAVGFVGSDVLSLIERLATNPAVDVQKLSSILDLQERLLGKRAEAEFNQAFAAMALKMPRVQKNGTVYYPVDKGRPQGPKAKAFDFAKYEDIDALLRPYLQEHGFVVSFKTRTPTSGGVTVIGELRHVGGHKETSEITLPLDTSGGKNNLQGGGSSQSYGQRYIIKAMLNLVFEGEDDDGQRGGAEYINAAQQQELTALLNKVRPPLAQFLDWLNAESVETIEVKNFRKAVSSLNQTLEKQKKGGGA